MIMDLNLDDNISNSTANLSHDGGGKRDKNLLQKFNDDIEEVKDNKENLSEHKKPSVKSITKLSFERSMIEIYPRRIRVLVLPQVEYFPNLSSKINPCTINISRVATIGELHLRVILAIRHVCGLSGQSQAHDHPVRFFLEWSRFWKVDWSRESVKDLPRQVQLYIN